VQASSVFSPSGLDEVGIEPVRNCHFPPPTGEILMPRKSAAQLAASPASPPLAPSRVQPPPGLASDERALFLGIVLGTKAEHFQQADVPLLASYVRACVMEEVASAEIKRALTNGGNASLALKVHERMAKTIS
jgi:hypothetical protein